MWLFYVIFVTALSGRMITHAQFPFDDDASLSRDNFFEVDGFVFDGPADRPSSNGVTTSSLRSSTPTPTTTTPRTPTTTVTASPLVDALFDACVARCPATPEYNPVCGSDNVDYDNPGRLSCAATCGKDITLKYYGKCATTKIRGG
nr:uncharacterized protein LOC117603880 isoform X1 [Osmia lignaria]